GRAPGSSPPRSPRRACPLPASACRTLSAPPGTRWRSRPLPVSRPNGCGAAADAAAASGGDVARLGGGHPHGGGGEKLATRQQIGHGNTPVERRVRRLRGRAGPVNLLLVDFADPPSMRAVIRGVLGAASVVVGLALVVVSIDEGHVEGRLVALLLSLWGAWSFFGALLESVVEPLGRFLGTALTGGAMSGGSTITIDDETAMLERLLDADPPPPRHR